MLKFARGVRFTSKKQRETYQRHVNDLFKKQMNYLSHETGDFIPDQSDTEARAEQRKKMLNDLQQQSVTHQKNSVELKEDIDVKNIRDIAGFEVLLMANQQPMPPQPA